MPGIRNILYGLHNKKRRIGKENLTSSHRWRHDAEDFSALDLSPKADDGLCYDS